MSEQGQQEKDWRNPYDEPFTSKKYKNFYQLASGAFVTVVILLIGGFIYSNPQSGYWVNIYATIVGTILTIALLDIRAKQRSEQERKEELILQMGSPNNAFAVEAVRLLKLKGWLFDGSLINADLTEANLQDVNLADANLQGARLGTANLRRADLLGANLQNAILSNARLQEADLSYAKLQGAYLFAAQLQGARLRGIKLSRRTLMPDGSWGSDKLDTHKYTYPEGVMDEYRKLLGITPPKPLTFEYIERPQRPRWRDMR